MPAAASATEPNTARGNRCQGATAAASTMNQPSSSVSCGSIAARDAWNAEATMREEEQQREDDAPRRALEPRAAWREQPRREAPQRGRTEHGEPLDPGVAQVDAARAAYGCGTSASSTSITGTPSRTG